MAYLDITTVVVLYPVPCVQVTVSDSVADYNQGGRFPPATPGVNRINADGTVEQVRAQATTDANGRSVWLDYEAPQQEQFTYQAAIRLLTGTPPVSVPAIIPDVGAWLINPSNPAGSVPLQVKLSGFGQWQRVSAVSVVPIAGSKVPYVVESSVRQAATGDLDVWVTGADTYAALTAILDSPGPKMFSFPRRYYEAYGDSIRWCVVLTSYSAGYVPGDAFWDGKLTLQPSGRPTVVAASFSKSWEDLRGKTWDDLRGMTWADL